MEKCVPLWLFLLTLLFGLLFTVFFGWSAINTFSGGGRTGKFGEAALTIASFPSLVKTVFSDVLIDTLDQDKLMRVPRHAQDLSGFTPLKNGPGVHVEGLLVRADAQALARTPGWRVLVGAFTIKGEPQQAVLAISPKLVIRHAWLLSETDIEGQKPSPPHRKLVHGVQVMPDASVIVAFDGGVSLQRFDRCGKRLWAVPGRFNHSVMLDESGEYVWTLRDTDIIKVAAATGQVVKTITVTEIIDANPDIDILDIRRHDDDGLGNNHRVTPRVLLHDPHHLNDADPLPAALAGRYPGFEAGDLLISARSLNLLFVMDPDTLRVKWWRVGATVRQHDPDWSPSGAITVFDNRMERSFSRIVSIDPASYRTNVLFDGRSNDFYTRIRGKHQITPAGNLLVTASHQGRYFEVDAAGRPILEVINTKPGDARFSYALSEAAWFPPDAFNFEKEHTQCKN